MAKHIMQFRYYKDGHENNQPKNITENNLVGYDELENPVPTVFKNYLDFTQLGIQALPGTRFYLNDNRDGPIIIGSSGIYELELEGISKITDLKFDRKSIDLIARNNNAYLIIDVIYES